MRARSGLATMALFWILGAGGCTKDPVTEPEPPPLVRELEFEYSARFANSDGGFVVKRVEYADVDGVVREVRNPLPAWSHTLKLKRGDRMYIRAESDFDGAFWSAVQIVGPEEFYRGDRCERADGPGTCVVVIDQLVE